MPDFEPKLIPGIIPGRERPNSGLPYTIIGSLFILCAIGFICLVLLPEDEDFHRSSFISKADRVKTSAITFIIGAVVFSIGLWQTACRRKFEAAVRNHPNEPWIADFGAGIQRISDGSASGLKVMIPTSVLALIIAIWADYSMASKGLDFWHRGESIVNFVALALCIMTALTIVQIRKFGTCAIRLHQFPALAGEPLRLNFEHSRPHDLKEIIFYLGCIEEFSPNPTSVANIKNYPCRQIYGDSISVHMDESALREKSGIEVCFPLPAGDYSTQFISFPRRSWILHAVYTVNANSLSVVYRLPIYSRSDEA